MHHLIIDHFKYAWSGKPVASTEVRRLEALAQQLLAKSPAELKVGPRSPAAAQSN